MQNVFWSALLQLISKRFFYSGYKRSRMFSLMLKEIAS